MRVCSVWTVLAATVAVLVALRFAVNGRLPLLAPQDMRGKVVVITGATSGVGKETARILASWGAHVVIGARNESKGASVRQYILDAALPHRASVDVWELDLAKLGSVKRFAHRFLATGMPLHVLVNNAGVGGLWQERRTENKFETTFQVNHLSHFLLTNMLLTRLKESAPARVVTVSSDLHFKGQLDFQNMDSEKFYDKVNVYQNTKLYNVLFSNELNRRLQGTGVVANSLHPGFVRTALAADLPPMLYYPFAVFRFLLGRTEEEGALTSVYVASSADDIVAKQGGQYFDSARLHEQAPLAQDPHMQERLWRASEAMLRAASFQVPKLTA